MGGLPTLLNDTLSRSTKATTLMKMRVMRLGRASGVMPSVPKRWAGSAVCGCVTGFTGNELSKRPIPGLAAAQGGAIVSKRWDRHETSDCSDSSPHRRLVDGFGRAGKGRQPQADAGQHVEQNRPAG